MINEVCGYLKNYFYVDVVRDNYSIVNGAFSPSHIKNGQYYRIVGSMFNDGIHKKGSTETFTNETFTGDVYGMAVPKEFLSLVDDITAWSNKYKNEAVSPFQSESFASYSYTKASGENAATTWQTAFKSRLARWRKV